MPKMHAAKAKSEEGDEHAALALYLESLALDRKQPMSGKRNGASASHRRMPLP